MIESKTLWNPVGLHGELTIQDGVDLEAQIREAVRKFFRGQILDIKYYLSKRDDGTDLVYFEILD